MAVASVAGSSLIAGLLAGGKTIFWAASWLCTWVFTTECPHSSSPPPTARTTASTSPATVATASKVLLRMAPSPFLTPGSRSRYAIAFVAFHSPLGRWAAPRAGGPHLKGLGSGRGGAKVPWYGWQVGTSCGDGRTKGPKSSP